MLSRRDIEVILYDEMSRTRIVADKVRQNFNEANSDSRTDSRHSDGPMKVTNARKLIDSARESYMTALREFNKFVFDGKIPGRLQGNGEARPQGLMPERRQVRLI
jgi:hypothetical protein